MVLLWSYSGAQVLLPQVFDVFCGLMHVSDGGKIRERDGWPMLCHFRFPMTSCNLPWIKFPVMSFLCGFVFKVDFYKNW